MDKREIKKIFKILSNLMKTKAKNLDYNADDALIAVKSKAINKAYNVFASFNPKKITDYLSGAFLMLPNYVQSQIVYATCHLTLNGESIYSNVIDGTPFNIWKYFESTNPSNEDRTTLSKYAKELLKTKVCPKAVPDLFGIYSNNVVYTSLDMLLADLEEFGNLRIGDQYYIGMQSLRSLIKVYTKQNPTNIEEFYEALKKAVENSPRLKESGLLTDIHTYSNFFISPNAYENYKFLISKEPDIKKAFYESHNPNSYGFTTFTRVLKNLSDEESLKCIAEYVQDEMYVNPGHNADLIANYIGIYISNKELLTNFELCMPIYKALVDSGPALAMLFFKDKIPYLSKQSVLERFKKSEALILRSGIGLQNPTKLTDEEKIMSIINDYTTCGPIDINTLFEVVALGQSFNRNLDLPKLKGIIAKNENLRAVLADIVLAADKVPTIVIQPMHDDAYPIWVKTPYDKALHDLSVILPKTRFSALPELPAYKKMSPALKAKFNLKVWNQFASLPLFNKDDNSKKALIEFIAVMGLFENDPNVEQRRKKAYEFVTSYNLKILINQLKYNGIFSALLKNNYSREQIAKALNKPASELNFEEMYDFILSDIFVPCKIKEYHIRYGVQIPPELAGLFDTTDGKISELHYGELKKLTGSYGKKMGDFLSPYAKIGNTYKLKHGVTIPEELVPFLPTELSVEQYNYLITDGNFACFLNPVKEVILDGYTTNPNLPAEKRDAIYSTLYSCGLPNYVDFGTIHRMFDGCAQEFNEEFYNLIVNNMSLFLEDEKKQSAVKALQKSMNTAIEYYKANGNSQPTLLDLFTFMETTPFEFEFGNKEFASLAKNAGIKTQSVYNRYQELLPLLQKRKKTTIPRHEKTYTYVDKDGKEYKVMTKILRLDDPMTMLVGESQFTNCCQVYGNAGEECMVHASSSENGGIFAVYLINEKGMPEMLTQSWIWTREAKLCLDNVEATALITSKQGKEKRLYQDIATFGIIQASSDIVETSAKGVEKYIAEKTKKILNSSTLSETEKQQELRNLDILRQRQTLQIVTVGEGCDDLNVAETFKDREIASLSQGPKGYVGYRDSGLGSNNKSKQHIVLQTSKPILPVDEDYHDVPIFRDERKILHLSGKQIPQSLLKHITDIELVAHKKEMLNYTDEAGKPVIIHPQHLADVYECNLSDLHIIAGEDWYYIYSDDGETIEVYDFAKCQPRLEDEANEQQSEMGLAFNTILRESVLIDENGQVLNVKKINADLREDTSYILYLFQKRRGVVAQIGQDLRYKYEDQENMVPVSENEQELTLKNFNAVKSSNPTLAMHKVQFVASDKTIKRIVNKTLASLQERSST